MSYHCVPMLDGDSAGEHHYLEAVQKVMAWRREGKPVLVHCAYGYGRSVAVCIGVMIAEGHATDWEDALAKVQQLRPRARLSFPQRRMVAKAQPALRHLAQ